MFFNSSINCSITSSTLPQILILAISSRGVGCKLTMAKSAVFRWPMLIGKSMAGFTWRLLPNAKHKSAFFVWCCADSIAPLGNYSPKFMIESRRSPPHSSHYLPVICTLNLFWPFRVLKSLIYPCLQFWQVSRYVFPCNSEICSGLTPLLRWSPSMFYDIINLRVLFSKSSYNAWWAKVGKAAVVSTLLYLDGFSIHYSKVMFPVFFSSHLPGPVSNIVLCPDL